MGINISQEERNYSNIFSKFTIGGKNVMTQGNTIRSSKYRIRLILMLLIINSIYFAILQISSQTFWQLFSLKIIYAVVNLGVLFAVVAILYTFTNKICTSQIILGGGVLTYAVINIYVVEFHRTPLTIPELANTMTALNVLKGYSFIEIKPLILITIVGILALINALLINKLRKYEVLLLENSLRKSIIIKGYQRGVILLCGCIYIIGILHVDWLIEPMRGEWHFKEVVGKYGYPLYFLTSGLEYELSLPTGYSEDDLASLAIDDYIVEEEGDVQAPNIILILNESFYDISLVTDIKTDIDYMGTFYNMDNTISGHAIVPRIGGGTNSSEYELLTANSTYLMPGITPFQVLNMTDTSSIVTNLKQLGYYTIAMHPSVSDNYGRNRAYPCMGFDEIYFLNNFENIEYYGKRTAVTDKSAYENMIQWYEDALRRQKPVFSYLLTMQNHGEWNINPSTDDVVHVIDYDNKVYEEKINEYLSCILLSTKEINLLIEYLKKSDRPVILCMVGDHAPSFIEEISDKNDNNAILQRATPFKIWANFPIDERTDVMVSMNELGPLLLDVAGVEMLPYYRYLLQLGEDVPVLTSYGNYIDRDGDIWNYTDDTKYSTDIQRYFWLEYNNIQKESMDEWFNLP